MPVAEVALAKDVGLLLEPYLAPLLSRQSAPSGDEAYAQAKALWDKVSGYAPVMAAAEALVADPDHVEKQATLRFRIKIEIEADHKLETALRALL